MIEYHSYQLNVYSARVVLTQTLVLAATITTITRSATMMLPCQVGGAALMEMDSWVNSIKDWRFEDWGVYDAV